MARDPDVEAFHERATGYESGWRGDLHHRIADRAADIAIGCAPAPRRVLDLGCGTGYLLRQLAARCPQVTELVGLDPASGMIEVAAAAASHDARLHFSPGVAERVPYPGEHFDLVVSTTSFYHWADQRAGLLECARVLAPGGDLVLTDRFSVMLTPTLLVGHRGRARTVRRASALLAAAGFQSATWHNLSGVTLLAGLLIRTATAKK
jgi:ubiquinone/menaquinone biosynthesis C-methylase UbiE